MVPPVNSYVCPGHTALNIPTIASNYFSVERISQVDRTESAGVSLW